MSRIFALVVGTSFFVVGLMGLLREPLVSDGLLHDVFAANPMHGAVRLTVGILGVLAYATGWARSYCAAFAGFFLLAGLLGLIPGATAEGVLLGLISVNLTTNILHLLLCAAAAACVPQHNRRGRAGTTHFR